MNKQSLGGILYVVGLTSFLMGVTLPELKEYQIHITIMSSILNIIAIALVVPDILRPKDAR